MHPPPPPPFSLPTLLSSRYNSGKAKYLHLLSSIISLPSVLSLSIPSPSPPLPFSLSFLSLTLRLSSLSVYSLSLPLSPSRVKAQDNILTLPTLPLKLVLSSINATLESIYSPRRSTLAYTSRHTAVRYIKNNFKNPNWWFKVAIPRQPFRERHVSRLIEVLGGKIEDPQLFLLIGDLFESQIVSIELGGTQLGKGLPQESCVVSTFVNIYFDLVDKELEKIRIEVQNANPSLNLNQEELNGDNISDSRVFHQPIRVYAVRYLDEILVATSGSKSLILDIKDRILHVLECKLGLKIDRFGSSIHSAVSEKLGFMGFEFQAVEPSILYPPMSEKSIRAKKKYQKMKMAKKQELKNARETRRKKLGLKILNHLFKRVKRGETFDLGFKIENEIKEIFDTWGKETLKEYFESVDNLYFWHRHFTNGDFLKLDKIRYQLPDELVRSYDEFQNKVDEHLSPFKKIKALEREEREKLEKEERKYNKRTIDDLSELKIRVLAPIQFVRNCVKLAGFTNQMGRPRPIKLLLSLDDIDIIKYYASVGIKWLDFYSCCSNFKMVKTIVTYHLRFSCILTLAEKHECTKNQAISHFSKDLIVNNQTFFPSEREIKMMGQKLTKWKKIHDPIPVDNNLTMILIPLAINEIGKYNCVAHFCDVKDDTGLYRVRLLQNRLNVSPLNERKWALGLGPIHESLNKKCLALCERHKSDLLLGKISLQDVDCTLFVDFD